MSDYERYGDYNEVDEVPGKKNPVVTVIKILIGLLCLSVAGVLIFRIVLFNYYPDSMEKLEYTDSLNSYLEENGSAITETQKLRFPYDDEDEGNFFADNLILVREAGQLQISIRYNVSLMNSIKEKYGVELDPDADIFEFTLAKTQTGYVEDEKDTQVPTESIGKLANVERDSKLMYRYYKLCFDNIDFGTDDGEETVSWIRLEVRIRGVEMKEPYMILVYENHESFAVFEELESISAEGK